MKRQSGHVSIFLAISSVVIFSLFCTLLESGRAYALHYLNRQGSESAIQSVFAAFEGDVMREYGILLRRGKENGRTVWTEEAKEYLTRYWQPGIGSLYEEGDRLMAEDIRIQDLASVYITGGNGRIFISEVEDYMKSAGLSVLIKEFMERVGLYNEEDGFYLLSSLKEMLGNKEGGIENVLKDYKDIRKKAKELQKMAQEQENKAASGNGQGAADEGGKPSASSRKNIKSDLLEQIKAVRRNGLIAVITGTQELSKYSWEDPDLPSRLPALQKNANASFAPSRISLLDHFLLGEFMMHKMGHYRAPRENGAAYEAEYVLCGKNTDKASFEMVMGELLLIRIGLNMAHMITDAEKLSRAEMTAVSILSVFALPQLTLILKWLLVAGWTLAESIVDLRRLAEGKKVPLWKTKASWQLKTLKLDLSAEAEAGGGLLYEDYLRLLFYLGDAREQAYRMMDVMQKRIGLKKQDFMMDEYMVYAAASIQVTAPYLYIQIPAFLPGQSGRGRKYSKQAAYGYGRR